MNEWILDSALNFIHSTVVNFMLLEASGDSGVGDLC